MPGLDVLLEGVGDEAAHVQVDGKWSIAQSVGHLSDVEELSQERLEDLRQSRAVYTAALPARFQAAAARLQSRSLRDTVVELATRRARLVEALATAPVTLQRASAFHERPMVPV